MIILRVGPNKEIVDTEEISKLTINLRLKDVKEYGKRNISYTKPLKILRTKRTASIFGSLNNLNITNGYEITNIQEAELVDDGVVILSGYIRIEKIYDSYYSAIIVGGGFNLYNDIGDNLIVGNVNSDDDIVFDSNYGLHTYSRDLIRSHLNADPSDNGKLYMYPIIDYDNTLNTLSPFRGDYDLLPAIAVRELFDKIFSDNGYTYTLSDDISTYINQMYIPFNDDVNKYKENWYFAYYRFGTPDTIYDQDGVALPPSGKWEIDRANLQTPYIKDDTDLYPEFVEGALYAYELKRFDHKDEMFDRNNLDTEIESWHYDIPKSGVYNFEYNILYGKATNKGRVTLVPIVDENVYLKQYRNKVEIASYDIGVLKKDNIGDASINDASVGFLDASINNISLMQGDNIYTVISNSKYNTERLAPLYDNSTNFKITQVGALLGHDQEFNMNAMRPINYKQSELLDDIFKMFNCYIESDKKNPKHLNISSYVAFNSDPTLKDWSDKLDQKSLKNKGGAMPFKNSFAKQTILEYTNDKDVFNEDFEQQKLYTLGTKVINNDSNFAYKTNKIKLKVASTAIKTVLPIL